MLAAYGFRRESPTRGGWTAFSAPTPWCGRFIWRRRTAASCPKANSSIPFVGLGSTQHQKESEQANQPEVGGLPRPRSVFGTSATVRQVGEG